MIGLVEVLALAGTLVAALVWGAVVFLVPRRRLTTNLAPAALVLRARAWLFAPIWVPAALLGAALLPGIAGIVVSGLDHCDAHLGHHHHLCLRHLPHATGHLAVWVLPVAAFAPAVIALGTVVGRLVRELRHARALVALSRRSGLGSDVRILDRPEPVALTVGWLRPTILLSSGLVERASAATLRVVLEHERAHVERGDTAWAFAERAAAALLPGSIARALLAESAFAREVRCDAIAAGRAGGMDAVVRALAEVIRLGVGPAPVGVSIADAAVVERARRLLCPQPGTGLDVARVAVGAVLVTAFGAAPVHTAVEHLFTFAFH